MDTTILLLKDWYSVGISILPNLFWVSGWISKLVGSSRVLVVGNFTTVKEIFENIFEKSDMVSIQRTGFSVSIPISVISLK